MKAPFTAAAVATLACLTLAACTVHQTQTPAVSGPSDLALSARMEANPDSIGLDGGSQSSIRVFTNGPDGKPLAGLTFRVDMAVNTSQGLVVQDFGALSARSIVTGSDGVARVIYTAPAAPPNGLSGLCDGVPGTCVTIIATPTSTNFGTVTSQSVRIRLVPLGVILPPATTPTPCMTISPAAPGANIPAQFTAGTLVGSACTTATSDIVAFDWSFGDGTTASGRVVSHTFTAANNFVVTLTETNDRGVAASATQTVVISAASLPTPGFTLSPAAPAVNEPVFFNASTSTPGAGHSIASYSWDFGDGTTGSGVTTSHRYIAAGTYTVVLTIRDEAGQSGSTSQTIGVGTSTSGPTSNFTFSPTAPVVNEQVVFDASSSTTSQGQTITSLDWNFGDDTPIVHSTSRITTHTFSRTGTFVVNLVVTDSANRIAAHSATVTVGSGAPTASFTFAVINAATHTMGFDGSGSTAQGGATIVSYAWTFGDTTSGAGQTTTHSYPAAGTFTVRLTVTDSLARVGSSSQSVTVP
jgi:PKD repeat protein